MSLRGGTTARPELVSGKQTRSNASVEGVNLRRDCLAVARNDK